MSGMTTRRALSTDSFLVLAASAFALPSGVSGAGAPVGDPEGEPLEDPDGPVDTGGGAASRESRIALIAFCTCRNFAGVMSLITKILLSFSRAFMSVSFTRLPVRSCLVKFWRRSCISLVVTAPVCSSVTERSSLAGVVPAAARWLIISEAVLRLLRLKSSTPVTNFPRSLWLPPRSLTCRCNIVLNNPKAPEIFEMVLPARSGGTTVPGGSAFAFCTARSNSLSGPSVVNWNPSTWSRAVVSSRE